MKYIRTKDDHIYELSSDIDFEKIKENYVWCFDKRLGFHFKVDTKIIIQQSDTIKELCDEAVFFDKDNVSHYKSKEGNIWYLGAGLFTESLRFGIFTDKGLIYVAKMNEQGELELL